jgi:hypothetical protein
MSLHRVLDRSLLTRVPTLVWGSPGVGKSSAVESWARDRGLPLWTVIASVREPSDFAGLPVVDATDGTVRFAPPAFAREANETGGVLFFDELTTAPPAVQSALLRAVLEMAFGDLRLDPERVAVVAAANPTDEAAGGWDLAPPLANRFSHFDFHLSADEWATSFPGYWGRPPTLRFGDREVPESDWARARVLVAAFLRTRPNLLHALPNDDIKRAGPWPSPRSWDYASRALALIPHDRPDQSIAAVAGCVGTAAASEYLQWVAHMDLPDPRTLLRRPSSYKHPERSDKAYVILSSVVNCALGDLTDDTWRRAWKVLERAARSGGVDVAAAAARALARGSFRGLSFPKEAEVFRPLLHATGLL